jgi:hypothetical protein
MSAFEFFFTFYGLVLGLSVVELVAGVARMVDAGDRLRVGWLTPMLATFLALDIATFWNQSWVLHQQAPFSYPLLVLALITAGLFYISAYLAFPRKPGEGDALDDHYWKRRRIILLGVALANLLNGSLILSLIIVQRGGLPFGAWLEVGAFFVLILMAALLPRGRAAAIALGLLLAIAAADVVQDSILLAAEWPWPLGSETVLS